MIKIPKWLYAVLAVLAVSLVAAQSTLVGRVTWLGKDSNGAQYIVFGLELLVLLGFGATIKDGVKLETVTETTTLTATTTKPAEPAPLPPPPEVKP